jgi:hypothetical protein
VGEGSPKGGAPVGRRRWPPRAVLRRGRESPRLARGATRRGGRRHARATVKTDTNLCRPGGIGRTGGPTGATDRGTKRGLRGASGRVWPGEGASLGRRTDRRSQAYPGRARTAAHRAGSRSGARPALRRIDPIRSSLL